MEGSFEIESLAHLMLRHCSTVHGSTKPHAAPMEDSSALRRHLDKCRGLTIAVCSERYTTVKYPPAATNSSDKRRPDIQGLRAIAVMLVLVYHSGLSLVPGGYVGVDVFFVISGFLISGMLVDELHRDGRINLAEFYARRFRRLLPAATVVIVATLVVAKWFYAPLLMKTLTSDAIATAGYMSNFWFAHLATDYLTSHGNVSPLLHSWSLAVEEQFYLFWPAFLILTTKYAARENYRRRIFNAIAFVAAISFFSCVVLTTYSQPLAFFGSPTRAWEFAAGALTALYISGRYRVPNIIERGAVWFGLALVGGSALSFSDRTQFPGFAAVIPVVGTSLIIAFPALTQASPASRLLTCRPMQYVGDISYSLYLWHWPVFVFLGMTALPYEWLRAAAGISASFVLAILSYHAVENPFRFNKTLKSRRWIGMGICGAMLTIVLGVAITERISAAEAINSTAQKRFSVAAADIPPNYTNGCHREIPEESAEPCITGVTQSDKIVVLFGDSHAVHWFPALEIVAEKQDFRLVTFTKSGCPAVIVDYVLSSLKRIYSECTRWRENAYRRILELQPDLVIISNSYGYYTDPDVARQWPRGVRTALSRLTESGIDVAMIRGTPALNFSAPNCLARANWRNRAPAEACSYKLNSAINPEVDAIESAAVDSFEKARRIDMTRYICAKDPCLVETPEAVIFSDESHLTATFSRTLADAIGQALVTDPQR